MSRRIAALLVAGIALGAGTALAASKAGAKMVCACDCVRQSDHVTVAFQLDAPGGDPGKCASVNNTICSVTGPGGAIVEGRSNRCQAEVVDARQMPDRPESGGIRTQ